MMDSQLVLVAVGIVVVCALVLMAISMLGMKEKTYEEAIAEQRKLPEEHLLLGRSAKDKARDKKQKKAGKKVKEKTSDRDKTEHSEGVTTKTSAASAHHEKVRVDFEEPEAEVVSERPPQEEKKKKKNEKVRPILLNKEEQSLVVEAPVTPTNHFEEILPKDDCLLKRKESREDVSVKGNDSAPQGNKGKPSNPAPKVTAPKPEKPQASKPAAPLPKEQREQPAAVKQQERVSSSSSSAPKEQKESALSANNNNKQEKAVKQEKPSNPAPPVQTVNPPVPVTAVSVSNKPEPQTPPPVKERSRKKRSELATLQQMSGDNVGVNVSLLMPLVQKAVLSRSEIQILIDLLLNKQQGSAISSSEWFEGRQDPVVKLKKQLSEKEKALSEQQDAHLALETKLKELRSELNSEKSRLSHSVRQLEETVTAKQNEVQALGARLQHALDNSNVEKQALTQQVQQLQQKLNEEHVRLRSSQEEQATLSQELLSQRQQLEVHIGHLSEQEAALKNQVAQLEGLNATLTAELQAQQGQILHYKDTAEQYQELVREVEELNHLRTDLEHRLSAGQQHEAALKFETTNVRSKLEELQAKLSNQEAVVEELRDENENLLSQLSAAKEMQVEVQHLRDENTHLSSQAMLISEMQHEARQLREENESLAAQVTAVTERPAAEGRENGDLHYPEEKQSFVEEDRLQHDNVVKQKDILIEQLEADLKQKEGLLEKITSELNTYKTDLRKLSEELEDQRRRNNEISQKVRQEEQLEVRRLLQRIFPDVTVEDDKVHHQWIEQFEARVRDLVCEWKSRPQHLPVQESSAELIELEKQNSHLQTMLANYKTIIDDTEGMLNNLQTHVEQEEANWKQQMQLKQAELEAALERQTSSPPQPATQQMQSKLQELEEKLALHESEKTELGQKYEAARLDCTQLEETRRELASQLQLEMDRRQDLTQEVSKLRSMVQMGKDALSQEQALVLQLQQQVNGVSQNHNVASNGPASEPSITEGGSGKK